MTRFYFHVRDGNLRFEDRVGADLPDLVAAWNFALIDARRLMHDQALEAPLDQQWIEIGDETGAVVASMPLSRLTSLH